MTNLAVIANKCVRCVTAIWRNSASKLVGLLVILTHYVIC